MSEEDDNSESRNEKPVDSTEPPALPTPTPPVSNLSTLPVSTVPITTVPVNTVPVSTVPATTVPATTVPVQYHKLSRLGEQATWRKKYHWLRRPK